jgi:hypothetical protein
MLAVDVASDRHSEHTTIAVRMPGNMPPHFAEAAKRKLEYELQKMQAEMSGALMHSSEKYRSSDEYYRAMMMEKNSNAMMQATALPPYAQGMIGGSGLGQAMMNQAAGVQSAQPMRSQKSARKKLLLCEVRNAV